MSSDFGAASGVALDGAAGDPSAVAAEMLGGEGVIEDTEVAPATMAGVAAKGYEVPFTLMQCISLMFIIMILSLGGC